MKNNLKEKELTNVKKKSKILSNETFENNQDNQQKQISFSDIWQKEIEDLKKQEFKSLSEVKKYIVDVIAKKENLLSNKEFLEFANIILEDNPQIDDILQKLVK